MKIIPHPEQLAFDFHAPSKRCTRCHAVKPLPAFGPLKASRAGRKGSCKECLCAKARTHYREHPEEMRARGRAYHASHKEARNAQSAAYYASHKEQARDWHRRNRAAKLDYLREQVRTYRRNHRAQNRQYQGRTRAHRTAWQRAWREAHPAELLNYVHRRRALKLASGGHFTRQDIRTLELAQAGLCTYCAQPYGRYHIDHKIPLARGGSNSPDNLCLACASCNLRKHAKTDVEFRALLAQEGG